MLRWISSVPPPIEDCTALMPLLLEHAVDGRVGMVELPVRALHADGEVAELLHVARVRSFMTDASGPGPAPLRQRRAAAQPQVPDDLAAAPDLREPLAEQRIVGRARARAARRSNRSGSDMPGAAGDRDPLVRQRRDRDLPAVVDLAEDVRRRARARR